jgi:ankyrin repeat protein
MLMIAAQDGNNSLVQLLIDNGASVNARNEKFKDSTAMPYATRNEHESIEQQLRTALKKRKQAARITDSVVHDSAATKTSAPPSLAPQVSRRHHGCMG